MTTVKFVCTGRDRHPSRLLGRAFTDADGAVTFEQGDPENTGARDARGPEPTLPLDEVPLGGPAPVVVGIDGKRYPVRAPRADPPCPVAPPSPATFAVRQLRTAVDMLEGAVRAGAALTPDERREVGRYITRLRMLIGDEDTYDDEWHEHSMTAYRRLRRRR